MTNNIMKLLRSAPPTALFGLIVILIYILVASFATVIAPYGETEIVASEYEPWSEEYVLGTDNLGRDMLSRMIYGARNTVGIALITTIITFVVGGFFGPHRGDTRRLGRHAAEPDRRCDDVDPLP